MTLMPIPSEVEQVANALRLPVEGLVQRSMRAFLLQERRAVQMDIADFRDRYNVTDVTELRRQIEAGIVYSHPAWENSIEWEQLEIYQNQLRRLLDGISDV